MPAILALTRASMTLAAQENAAQFQAAFVVHDRVIKCHPLDSILIP